MRWARILQTSVLVGALGYFVDIYDLVLFSIVRTQSLVDLGVPADQQLEVGVLLLNWQMTGLLIGGLLWGVLGDKKGRVSVLFGSIFLYSVANVVNAFVDNIPLYAAMRFIAGIGLAGELGAAITLVAETLPKDIRGYGTALVAGVGLSGAVFAGILGDFLSWRVAYMVGGLLGFALLALRFRMLDSGIYRSMSVPSSSRGSLKLLFSSRSRALRYLYCVLIGVPIWFVVGILVTFSPEISQALGVNGIVSAGKGILFCYIGISIGDILSGFLSQLIQSRRKVVALFLAAELLLTVQLLNSTEISNYYYYLMCFMLGLATGYWAVFVTISAEQFGTNLRATVATSTPNLVRGSVVILTTAFQYFGKSVGIVNSALLIGVTSMLIGFFALSRLDETSGRDLNFIEEG